MNDRLTEKTNDYGSYNIDQDFSPKDSGGYDINFGSYTLENLVEKLGKLEDIEEEIGFDLIIVATALKRGIYDKLRFYQCACISLSNGRLGLYILELDRLFEFKDYGKTWALTKEELEKGEQNEQHN